MGFCAFLLLKSCHCCWGNPFPRSINHKVQQHNNINMWLDNSNWPDGSSSLTSRLFLDPRHGRGREISEADKEAESFLPKKVFFWSSSWYLEKDQSSEETDAFSDPPMPIECTHPSIPSMRISQHQCPKLRQNGQAFSSFKKILSIKKTCEGVVLQKRTRFEMCS